MGEQLDVLRLAVERLEYSERRPSGLPWDAGLKVLRYEHDVTSTTPSTVAIGRHEFGVTAIYRVYNPPSEICGLKSAISDSAISVRG